MSGEAARVLRQAAACSAWIDHVLTANYMAEVARKDTERECERLRQVALLRAAESADGADDA